MNKKSKEYSDRIITLRNEILQDIKSIFIDNKLSKIDISRVDRGTYIMWYDRDGAINEGMVLTVLFEKAEISLDIETVNSSIRVYEDDFAFTNPIWLNGIRDNILETLEDE